MLISLVSGFVSVKEEKTLTVTKCWTKSIEIFAFGNHLLQSIHQWPVFFQWCQLFSNLIFRLTRRFEWHQLSPNLFYRLPRCFQWCQFFPISFYGLTQWFQLFPLFRHMIVSAIVRSTNRFRALKKYDINNNIYYVCIYLFSPGSGVFAGWTLLPRAKQISLITTIPAVAIETLVGFLEL